MRNAAQFWILSQFGYNIPVLDIIQAYQLTSGITANLFWLKVYIKFDIKILPICILLITCFYTFLGKQRMMLIYCLLILPFIQGVTPVFSHEPEAWKIQVAWVWSFPLSPWPSLVSLLASSILQIVIKSCVTIFITFSIIF